METRAVIGMVGGRYRLHGMLGQGGMARVFDAFDERLERPVAVKVLRPETEALPGMRKRFQQEARISARLVHHNIVAVLDYGEDGAASYLVMERLPGRTLRDEIARGPMAPPLLVALMTETLAALSAAHKFGVLHRDIKPSNILLDDDGHAKITDFGIAKSFDVQALSDPTADLTMTGVVLGTPGYLAPERRAGHSATVQSDLYSVGAVMVEALSGQRPLPGANDEPPNIPPNLQPVAGRALASDPRQRFASADQMLHAMQTADRPRPSVAAPAGVTRATPAATAVLPVAPLGTATQRMPGAPTPSSPASRPRAWRRYLLPGLAAAIVAALLLIFVLESGPANQPPATSGTTVAHHHRAAVTDTEGSAIKQLATAIRSGGLPGDGALAAALDTTASASPGVARQTAAEETLTLATVLLAGQGISEGQFQDVVSVLTPTGASVPTTTTTTAAPATPGPGASHGHGGDKGPGGGQGGN